MKRNTRRHSERTHIHDGQQEQEQEQEQEQGQQHGNVIIFFSLCVCMYVRM